jgi:hypothetical protein
MKKLSEIRRARIIRKSLGVYTAARYLCNRQWSIEAALFILVGKTVCSSATLERSRHAAVEASYAAARMNASAAIYN